MNVSKGGKRSAWRAEGSTNKERAAVGKEMLCLSVTVAVLGEHGCGFTCGLLNTLLFWFRCDFLGNTVTRRNWGHPAYVLPLLASGCYLSCTGEKLPFPLPESNKREV